MNFDEVKELISIVDKSGFKSFELTLDNCNIKLDKTGTVSNSTPAVVPTQTATASIPVAAVEPKAEAVKTEEPAPVKKVDGNVVKAPLVGTFYKSASPDKPAFASVGKKVKKGDVLCIIEAMKIMNEVVSEFDGEVLEVCVENEELVEYGQSLFVIG